MIFFCEKFLNFVKSIKNYENSLKKSKNQDFNDLQYQPPLRGRAIQIIRRNTDALGC